jgi:response regulator RpfG family c-di-GMP phosphodiesterase
MKKILLVDDEPNLLAALQRALRTKFSIEIAVGGAAGLAMLQNWQEFAVVVSDMRMPGMDGVEFLTKVKEAAPDIVRIMLTGNSDQATAIEAINEGSIFRFLNKPCSPEHLAAALTAGFRQHQLITAERDLLENTLRGSIKVLTEILALADPKAFGHGEMLRDNMHELAAAMKMTDRWELEVAALLSPIGYVTIPAELLLKERNGALLSGEEQEMFRRIPAIGGSLLAQIPRLEEVAKILTYQGKCFDGSGHPDDEVAGAAIPQGARMLKILCDLADLEGAGKTHASALEQMRARRGWYDPQILELLNSPSVAAKLTKADPAKPSLALTFAQLRNGNVLRSDVVTRDGTLIVVAGNRITPALMARLKNFSQLSGIKEPIFVEA